MIQITILLAAMLTLSSCGGLDSPGSATANNSSNSVPLVLSSSADSINAGATLEAVASGGSPDYTFNLTGLGSLSQIGSRVTYTAPATTEPLTAEITVTDRNGATARVVIHVLATSVPSGSKIFSAAGANSFVVPSGVTSIRVTVVGGGGGAGSPGAHSTSFGSNIVSWGGGAGGAGAGGICKSTISVTPSQTIPLVVGSGGAGGTFNGLTFAGLNASGALGVKSTFATLEAGGGAGGGGGNGSYPGGSGAGGVAGAGGSCLVAGNLPSAMGSNGSMGQPASSVAGNQAIFHADGGAGGLGFILQTISCGQGATGEAKLEPFATQSRPGNAGCVLIEWGN